MSAQQSERHLRPLSLLQRSRRLPLLRHLVPSTPPMEAVARSPLFKIPVELRLQVYEHAFTHASLSPLYIEGRHVRRAVKRKHNHRTALLRSCRTIYHEARPVLYETHDLHLLLLRPSLTEDHTEYPVACSVARLQELITEKISCLKLTVEYGSSMFQQHTSVLLLRWVHMLLRTRRVPLQSLTVRLTDDERGRCSQSCVEVMEEIGRRFRLLNEPQNVVFSPMESECMCARAWTRAVSGEQNGPAGAEDVFNEAFDDLKRVPEWWEVYERLDGWVSKRLGRS